MVCWFSALLLSLTVPVASAQSSDPLIGQELQRLGQAQHRRFKAMLVMSMANQLSTIRITPEAATGDGALPRILHVLPDGLQLEQAGANQLLLGSRGWHQFAASTPDLAQIERGYTVRIGNLDRVDGRDALPLRFEPTDRWRYGTTLWIDRESGLVLKTEVRGTTGQTLAQAMLAGLELLESEATSTPEARAPTNMPPGAARRWQVQGLPDGFVMLAAAAEADREQLLIGDGMASVSVFVERLSAGQAVQRGQQQRGLLATQADVRGDFQLVAVGAVPPHTLERILNGLTPVP